MKEITFLTILLCAAVTQGCTTHHHHHKYYSQPEKFGVASGEPGTSGKMAAQAAKAQRKQKIDNDLLGPQQTARADVGHKGDSGQQRFSGAVGNNPSNVSGADSSFYQYEKETSHSLDVPFFKRLILEAFKLCIAARCGSKGQ